MRVCVVGTGYVGLVVAACLAEVGNRVSCFDVDRDKIAGLQQGKSPIYEPGLDELLQRNLRQKRLQFTGDIAESLDGAIVVVVAVGTPPAADGSADLSQVRQAAEMIGRHLNRYAVIANKSTVPVGTARLVRQIVAGQLQQRGMAEVEFDVVSCPEFLKEGAAVEDFSKPDRVVVGGDSQAAPAIIQELYAPFLHQSNRLQVMPVVSAELTKYAANAMLATRISFMNELAGLCEAVGADIEDIRRGIGADSRIGRAFLYAGAGFGGSCFPKDLRALAQFAGQYNCPADLINAVITVNERQKKSLFGKINKFFGGQLAGRVIAVWGLSFKPHTDDVREAPALVLIEDLRQAGARVRAYDPAAMTAARAVLGEQGIVYCDDEYQAAAGADAIALMTEWPQFRSPDFPGLAATMRQRAIFDGRNQYRPQFVRGQGFSYVGIGRPGDDC